MEASNIKLSRARVYDMLTLENEYARGWSKGKKDHVSSRHTGQPFTISEWLTFTDKYLNEAKLALANYLPDEAPVRQRLIKAASLLVTALQVHGTENDANDLAGKSSTKFPINTRGLADLKPEVAA